MHKWRVCVYTALLSAADQKCGSLWDAGISGNPTHIALVTSHENVAFHTPIDTYRVGKRKGIKIIISHQYVHGTYNHEHLHVMVDAACTD